ncbi:hypothetical protein [Pantoea vagans]|uniref:hypothetical protein n=1 Tax=Pantoea vagans TaxID=470934 RepID=UPI0023B18FF8|nr:hypothetical protein [Pantoea vagans]MDE8558829.1 hypothetical protein [Pantoea vagans]MDE8578834.1 hypothetical protein [Pantoea vagans]
MYNQTLIVVLVDSDTNRIMADYGEKAGKGTQYIWLSMSCEDFFPPLDQRNNREKVAVFTYINLHYVDLNETDSVRVTHELNNNSDFRLSTGELKFTKLARTGDIACITRIGERDYQLRLISQESSQFEYLSRFATTSVGYKGKRIGYISNENLYEIL